MHTKKDRIWKVYWHSVSRIYEGFTDLHENSINQRAPFIRIIGRTRINIKNSYLVMFIVTSQFTQLLTIIVQLYHTVSKFTRTSKCPITWIGPKVRTSIKSSYLNVYSSLDKQNDVLIMLIFISPNDTPFEFQRQQYTISLIFANSTNKSQAQKLRDPYFFYWQLSVGCSSIGSPIRLYVNASVRKNNDIV